jgi:hypothetical protein
MIEPNNPKLFAKLEARAGEKFTAYPTYSGYKWVMAKYIAKGGIFTFSNDADKFAQEKADALNTIEKALTEKGFSKIDDNSFVVGSSILPCKTIANLLEISKSNMPWYEFLISDAAVIATPTCDIKMDKMDKFCIQSWGPQTALMQLAKPGLDPIAINFIDAHALVKSSRKLSARERWFRS